MFSEMMNKLKTLQSCMERINGNRRRELLVQVK